MTEGEGREGGTERQRSPDSCANTLLGLLAHPNRTIARLSLSVDLRRSVMVVLSLATMAAVLALLVSLDITHIVVRILTTIPGPTISEKGVRRQLLRTAMVLSVVGIPTGWLVFTGLLHGLARLLGGSASYHTMLTLLGYAATPMLVITAASLAIRTVLLPFPGLVGDTIIYLDTLFFLLWCAGMVWGCPGVLSYYALRHGEGLSCAKASGIIALAWVLLLAASLVLLFITGR